MPAGHQHRVQRGRLRVGQQRLQHQPGPAAAGPQHAGQVGRHHPAGVLEVAQHQRPQPGPELGGFGGQDLDRGPGLALRPGQHPVDRGLAGPHPGPGQPVSHRGQRPADGPERALVPRVLAGQQAAPGVVADERHPVRGGGRVPVLLPDPGPLRQVQQPGHVQPDGRVGQRGLVLLEPRPGHRAPSAASERAAPPPGPAASPGTARWRTRGRGARRGVRRSGGTRRGCSRPRPGTAGSGTRVPGTARAGPPAPARAPTPRGPPRRTAPGAAPPARRSSGAAGSRSARRSGAGRAARSPPAAAGPTAPEGGGTRRAPASKGPRPAGGRSKPARSGARGTGPRRRPAWAAGLRRPTRLPPRRSRTRPACTGPGRSARSAGSAAPGWRWRAPRPGRTRPATAPSTGPGSPCWGTAPPWGGLAAAPPRARSASCRRRAAPPGRWRGRRGPRRGPARPARGPGAATAGGSGRCRRTRRSPYPAPGAAPRSVPGQHGAQRV